jgi:hypothetical protein
VHELIIRNTLMIRSCKQRRVVANWVEKWTKYSLFLQQQKKLRLRRAIIGQGNVQQTHYLLKVLTRQCGNSVYLAILKMPFTSHLALKICGGMHAAQAGGVAKFKLPVRAHFCCRRLFAPTSCSTTVVRRHLS